MSVSAVTKINSVSTTGDSSYTTASFGTTSGNLIVVIVGMMTNSGSSDPSAGISCNDSLSASYTPVGTIGNASYWSQGLRVFVATSNGSDRTVIVDQPSVPRYQWEVIILELSGASGSVSGLVTNGSAGDDAISLTLGAAPATGDLTIFARVVDGGTNSAPPTLTMDAGWSATIEANANESQQGGVLGVSTRTGSTSTTVSCTDATSSSDSDSYQSGKCEALAITFTFTPIADTSSVDVSGTFNGIVDGNVCVGGSWQQMVEVDVCIGGVWNKLTP